jgi:hypothetical protein
MLLVEEKQRVQVVWAAVVECAWSRQSSQEEADKVDKVDEAAKEKD